VFIYAIFLIGNTDQSFVFLKNLINVTFLGALINFNHKIGFKKYSDIIISGFSLGSFIMIIIFIISNYFLFSFVDFSYYGLTYGLFNNVYVFLNLNLTEEFNSSLIYRNTYGELFVILFLLTSNNSSNKLRPVYFLLTILSFSRRAVFTLISYFLKYIKITNLIVIFVVVFLLLSLNIFEDSRFFSFTEETRLDQYMNLLNSIDNIFLGAGFAEPFEGRYIHNFILSNFYTIGIIGLLMSSFIYVLLLISFFKAFKSSNHLYYSLLFLIILNLSISSNVNGLLSPGVIIALSIISINNEKIYNNSRVK
tara:strand:- start:364 stop:1287 length:924 start_codon:yes stop_codon:yes gene_type:complete